MRRLDPDGAAWDRYSPTAHWRTELSESELLAQVTKRIKALNCNGKKVHTVGIPIHWGFIGETQNGYLSNTLTPYVGDANSQTPEFKAFLVNLEKA